ncbi:HNH endonuclease signature motif containing protein [Acinetobacter sp. B51(2017)]|uniref:HNH endonuclease n=1 Tax=Acinetobacter sp. B51(2017) TaxID=2060938 RepID=UPI000F07B87D|nr:HNH endonuclease signature motif containing protein [Acinetobacter sp. B51(2017)]
MAQTMLLKNVLNRRPMIAYPEQYSIQRDDFEITLADFAQSEIIDKLYKADNQRSTEYWSLRDIIRFINACTTDPNAWLTFLYWKDQQGNMYLIDGGHRLSSVYAWIKRYFIDEQVKDAPKFTSSQKEELRTLRKSLSQYADFQKIMTSELEEFKEAKNNIKHLKMRFVQVMGSPEDARRVFESMNSDTKSLDKNEAYHLSHRGTVRYYVTSACCYLDDNKSTLMQLGSDLENQMIELGEKIHHLVFQNMLLNTYMTHGKRIGIVHELFDILTRGDTQEYFSGASLATSVLHHLQRLYAVLTRMVTSPYDPHLVSLGLHPQLYFFKDTRVQITSLLAWFSIMSDIHDQRKLRQFTAVRSNVEMLIANFPIMITETIGKYGSGVKGHERLELVYLAFIEVAKRVDIDVDDPNTMNTIMMVFSKSFPYINFTEFFQQNFEADYDYQLVDDVSGYILGLMPSNRKNSTQFSSFTKALIKQRIEVARHNFCEVCDGLLHLDSIEHDHIIARSVGGRGDVDNGTLLHPYCNRFKADRELEEARADLFG